MWITLLILVTQQTSQWNKFMVETPAIKWHGDNVFGGEDLDLAYLQ